MKIKRADKKSQEYEYIVRENFLSQSECKRILLSIAEYRQNFEVAKIYRQVKPIPLSYSVIDGKSIQAHLLEIQTIYSKVNQLINQFAGEQLVPLNNLQAGCNINITEQGGTYRWHYDRNAVTAILYLNQIEGGEIELYPHHRIMLPIGRFSRLQNFFDRLMQQHIIRRIFGKQVIVMPQVGLLLLMRGDRCLHSVRPVLEAKDRINIVMAYDFPNTKFPIEDCLNSYLYSPQSSQTTDKDPNYLEKKQHY